ncbi:MAG: molybdopterin-dependent oxidoreductase, partial [Actinomycetia bacterium]|nr:molybdopterin-dependent oxidoreductase [Actinomycetes bacterium]
AEFRTNRQTAAPMEGRALLADYDAGRRHLTVHASHQSPHLLRWGLAPLLGMRESDIRVVTDDVGGGFGAKASMYPEDVAVCALARRFGRPVSWVDDRSEHLQVTMHARDHHYVARAGFDTAGRLLAVDATVHINVGAYSGFPWTAGIETLMAGGLLTGPYKLDQYRCRVLGVATNTTPAGPYRGVARPATTFVMERLLARAARALDMDPAEIRRLNLVQADEVPWRSPTRLVHDSPTYVEVFDKVLDAIDYPTFRSRQAVAAAQGRALGVGFACYNELTGLGRRASAGPGLPFRTGHESATIQAHSDGTFTLFAGVTSQGQGLETTMAQVASTELGVPLDSIRMVIGDTDGAFGLGAFASRQAVIGSGAVTEVARRLRQKILRIAAHLMEAEADWLDITDGLVHTDDAPARGVTVAEVAAVALLELNRLPDGEEPGLGHTAYYDPMVGTFAAGAQAALVEVDTETGVVTIDRIVCAEDAGTMLNPMIVEGQIHGAVAQGIGGALYEHLQYDDQGQLLTSTFTDYTIPSAMEIPALEALHVSHPADNLTGVRGVGEGGTIGPPAAIANAVADALGVEIDELPVTPERVINALANRPTHRPDQESN